MLTPTRVLALPLFLKIFSNAHSLAGRDADRLQSASRAPGGLASVKEGFNHKEGAVVV